ncbi:MAG: NAD(P)H-dependent oxidoreductase subunit E [Acidimicrobiales bacterium]
MPRARSEDAPPSGGDSPLEARLRELATEASRETPLGALLPVLHAVQDAFGYLPPETFGCVGEVLNLSRAEVYGTATFYKDFRYLPPGHSQIRLCGAEACQAVGAAALAEGARALLGVGYGETSAGGISFDRVFCLGNCALGPSVMVDGRVIGRVTAADLASLVTPLAEQATDGPPATSSPGGAPPGATATAARGVGPGQMLSGAGAQAVFVPAETAACSVGADEVAARFATLAGGTDASLEVIRNGSRGLAWLEPLVEFATPNGRVAYGPVGARDVDAVWADFSGAAGGEPTADRHRSYLGPTESIPWLQLQQRITFKRVGVVDPRSIEDYEAHGGFAGLRRALELTPAEIVALVMASGLRGRGGAGFPAGIKWQTVLDTPGEQKYVCCNADEGDSGTFADRMLMEGDPYLLVEGVIIAGLAVGATEGYLYIRSEYPAAVSTMRAATAEARRHGWLGPSVGTPGSTSGPGRAFELHIRVGAGAYICGEESSMLESLEGKRGVARSRPPLPAIAGLVGKPTLVNNVLTLAAVPDIVAGGADAYERLGTGSSRGTQVFQLAGNVARGGVFELPFGVTLGTLVNEIGGGTASGRPVRAVQVGGPLGSYLPPSLFDLPMDYEAFAEVGAMVGHGGIVVFDDTVDMASQARFAMEFCAEESCGKCTPCRVGAVRGVEVIDKITSGRDVAGNLELLEDLCELMVDGSLCAMGGLTPQPVRSALRHFAADFGLDSRDTEPARAK